MAIYEIARIQLRRGRANGGVGVPQLASGEMAWAIDTRELFIGNGAVAEGSPAVGNTRILTEQDLNQWGFLGNDCINFFVFPWEPGTAYQKGNIVSNNIDQSGRTYTFTFLCISEHISDSNFLTDYTTDPATSKWIRTPYLHSYKKPNVLTGLNENTPVIRCIQDRLSDRVSLKDFITIADQESNDYSAALQRAINQLFNNSLDTAKAFKNSNYRVILEIPAGEYKITNTIFIPSYASIVGAGSDKTIIKYESIVPGPAIKFDYDITEDNLGLIYTTQPRHILLEGFTIITNNTTTETIRLDSVRDSKFIDLNIKSQWNGEINLDNRAIMLTAVAKDVTCENNLFENIKITNFNQAVWSINDIKNNDFKNFYITNTAYGFLFGDGSDGATTGQEIGPKNSIIDSCTFIGISKQAVYIGFGTGNTVSNCTLINVGNDANGELEPFTGARYPQIYFDSTGNISENNRSERTDWLSFPSNQLSFIPEVCGKSVTYTRYGTWISEINNITNPVVAIRLPARTDRDGIPEKIANYIINYNYYSLTTNGYIRRGVINVSADYSHPTTPIQLVDEFDYSGLEDDESALTLRFSAEFNGESLGGINIFYENSLASEQGDLTYTYTVIF